MLKIFFSELEAEKYYKSRFSGRISRGFPCGVGTFKPSPYSNERMEGNFTFHTGRYEDYRIIVKNAKEYNKENKLVFEGDLEYSNHLGRIQYNGSFYDNNGNITEKVITNNIKDQYFHIGKIIEHYYYKFHHKKKFFDKYGIKYESLKGYHLTDETIWKLNRIDEYDLEKGNFFCEGSQYDNKGDLIYNGGCHNFKRNGKGVENYNKENEYQGWYFNNMRHGNGFFIKHFNDKIKYNLGYQVKIDSILDKMEYNTNNIRPNNPSSGSIINYKTVTLNDRYGTYTREIKYNDFIFDNGDSFVSDFEDNLSGTYKFNDGIKYVGGFNSSFKYHGDGTFYLPNGDRIECKFNNDRLVGNAKYIYKSGVSKSVSETDIFARYNKITSSAVKSTITTSSIKSTVNTTSTNKVTTSTPIKTSVTSSTTKSVSEVKTNKSTVNTASKNVSSTKETPKEFDTFIYDNGLYAGFVKDGKPHGFGKHIITTSNGNILYKGMFENGLKHGYFVIEHDGIITYGEYSKGRKFGDFLSIVNQNPSRKYKAWTRYYYSSDILKYNAYELTDNLNGTYTSIAKSYDNNVVKTVYFNKTGPRSNYSIMYSNASYFGIINDTNKPNGLGIMRWNDGQSYFGLYDNGLRSGFGVYRYDENTIKISNYINGLASGSIFYIEENPNGEYKVLSTFESNGKYDGPGTWYYSNGKKSNVTYKDGKLQ